MTSTCPVVSLDLTSASVRLDSAPTCPDTQPFSKVSDLRDGLVSYYPYAMYEPDFWLLSGDFKFLPPTYADVHVGLHSLSISDALGNFSAPPVLTVVFGSAHDIDGLILRFSQFTGDYATHVTIALYNTAGGLISTGEHYPQSWEFQTGEAVTGLKTIVITFHSTNRPYRNLRLTAMEYGTVLTFTETDVRTAALVEEVDPSLLTLPHNELELVLHTTNPAFNMISPSGMYTELQSRQRLSVYMRVGGEYMYIGNYYLDTWHNTSETEVEFRARDALGLLSDSQQLGGLWLSSAPTTVGALVQDIMDEAGLAFDLDPSLTDIEVSGWLPAGPCREALHHIAIAAGVFITSSRSGVLRLIPARSVTQLAPAYEHMVTDADKGMTETIELSPLVTSVELHAHEYSLNYDTEEELFNGALSAGVHTVLFSAPHHSLSVTGGSVISSGANFITVQVSAPATVTVHGYTYTDSTTKLHGTVGTPPPGAPINTVKVTDASLVSAQSAPALLSYLTDYFGQRYSEVFEVIAPAARPFSIIRVSTMYGTDLFCVVTRMETDMTGGYVVGVRSRGVAA